MTDTTTQIATAHADAIAASFNDPPWPGDVDAADMASSLSKGALGAALLHAARAAAGCGPQETAHHWLNTLTSRGVPSTAVSNLFYGAPAVAFVLSLCGPHYQKTRHVLSRHVRVITEHRLAEAYDRLRRGLPTRFREYDVLAGLAGIGAHLLASEPDGDLTRRVLDYFVHLTRPIAVAGRRLPGWWVAHDPSLSHSAPFAAGHANLGLAHGIPGPLALLAIAARTGVTVPGHLDAITTISDWIDQWRQPDPHAPWWPQWIKRGQVVTGVTHASATRPSWCYGTPGIARAQQLAGIVLRDETRQRAAERMLLACLGHQEQLSMITEAGICHGYAGILQTTRRVAQDALTPGLDAHIPALIERVLHTPPGGTGFLAGPAGTALALDERLSDTGWDACLLLT